MHFGLRTFRALMFFYVEMNEWLIIQLPLKCICNYSLESVHSNIYMKI